MQSVPVKNSFISVCGTTSLLESKTFILQLEREFQDKTFTESFFDPEKFSWTTGVHRECPAGKRVHPRMLEFTLCKQMQHECITACKSWPRALCYLCQQVFLVTLASPLASSPEGGVRFDE